MATEQFYAEFHERGYHFKSWIAVDAEGRPHFLIRIYRDDTGELVREHQVPMLYEPRFGVDVGDKQTLEEETEKLLKELPALPNAMGGGTASPL